MLDLRTGEARRVRRKTVLSAASLVTGPHGHEDVRDKARDSDGREGSRQADRTRENGACTSRQHSRSNSVDKVLGDMAFLEGGAPFEETLPGIGMRLAVTTHSSKAATRESGHFTSSCEKRTMFGATQLMVAAWHGDVEEMERLLETGTVYLDDTDMIGRTALMMAAGENQLPAASLLLESGADACRKDHFGDSALSIAARENYDAMVKLLMAHNADFDEPDQFGQTPLMKACQMGHEAVVEMLLEKGATHSHKDVHGETALMKAVRHGHPAVVRQLEAHGAVGGVRGKVSRHSAPPTPIGQAACSPDSQTFSSCTFSGWPTCPKRGRSLSTYERGAKGVAMSRSEPLTTSQSQLEKEKERFEERLKRRQHEIAAKTLSAPLANEKRHNVTSPNLVTPTHAARLRPMKTAPASMSEHSQWLLGSVGGDRWGAGGPQLLAATCEGATVRRRWTNESVKRDSVVCQLQCDDMGAVRERFKGCRGEMRCCRPCGTPRGRGEGDSLHNLDNLDQPSISTGSISGWGNVQATNSQSADLHKVLSLATHLANHWQAISAERSAIQRERLAVRNERKMVEREKRALKGLYRQLTVWSWGSMDFSARTPPPGYAETLCQQGV